MIRVVTIAILSSLLFLSCSNTNRRIDAPATSQVERPAPAALDGLDAKGAIALANRWYRQKQSAVKTNVTPQGVNFTFPNGKKKSVALPKDQMVVAVAPYITNTHPCETHFMSGCQGEMVGQEIRVKALGRDGKVLVDETMTTMYNGFVELWLPRDEEIRLSVGYQGKSAEGTITTFTDSNTCVTTLQLL